MPPRKASNEAAKRRIREFDAYLGAFDEHWSHWTTVEGEELSRPAQYRRSIRAFFNAGLGVDELREAVDIAVESDISEYRLWRYFCGVCWNIVRSR